MGGFGLEEGQEGVCEDPTGCSSNLFALFFFSWRSQTNVQLCEVHVLSKVHQGSEITGLLFAIKLHRGKENSISYFGLLLLVEDFSF